MIVNLLYMEIIKNVNYLTYLKVLEKDGIYSANA